MVLEPDFPNGVAGLWPRKVLEKKNRGGCLKYFFVSSRPVNGEVPASRYPPLLQPFGLRRNQSSYVRMYLRGHDCAAFGFTLAGLPFPQLSIDDIVIDSLHE